VDTCITYRGPCSLFIHLLEDAVETEESPDDSDVTSVHAETLIKAGREFAVAYSDAFIGSLKEHQAVSDIWFN